MKKFQKIYKNLISEQQQTVQNNNYKQFTKYFQIVFLNEINFCKYNDQDNELEFYLKIDRKSFINACKKQVDDIILFRKFLNLSPKDYMDNIIVDIQKNIIWLRCLIIFSNNILKIQYYVNFRKNSLDLISDELHSIKINFDDEYKGLTDIEICKKLNKLLKSQEFNNFVNEIYKNKHMIYAFVQAYHEWEMDLSDEKRIICQKNGAK